MLIEMHNEIMETTGFENKIQAPLESGPNVFLSTNRLPLS